MPAWSKHACRRLTATSQPYPRQASPRRLGRTGAKTGTPQRFTNRTPCPRSQSYARATLLAHIWARGALYTLRVSRATRATISSGAAVGGRPAAWNFPPLIRLLLQPDGSVDFSSSTTRAPRSRARTAAVTPAPPPGPRHAGQAGADDDNVSNQPFGAAGRVYLIAEGACRRQRPSTPRPPPSPFRPRSPTLPL
jgi:hypothetical protein